MRLIYDDYFIKWLGFDNTENERENDIAKTVTLSDFDNFPTAYDIDKVVERLEEHYSYDVGGLKMISLDKAIEIVKGGAE